MLDGDWRLRHQSMLTGSAPLAITFNGADENIYTFASSEVRKTTALRMGVHDETNEIHCELIMGLAQFKGQAPMTRLTVRADFRRIPFHRAVTDACQWWDTILQLQPMSVPRSCRLPMYSSWYNFHQAVTADTLERECALARKLGMETIILDDGWHSSHDAPGYGYTCDWEVCQEKFPDMRAHVQRVHDLGMKYMLWYSVPFIGYHASVKLINASHAPKLFIQLDEPMRAQVKISNTCGEVVSEQRLVLQPGIVALDIPCSGLAELEIAR